jgi:hypothetical protein
MKFRPALHKTFLALAIFAIACVIMNPPFLRTLADLRGESLALAFAIFSGAVVLIGAVMVWLMMKLLPDDRPAGPIPTSQSFAGGESGTPDSRHGDAGHNAGGDGGADGGTD